MISICSQLRRINGQQVKGSGRVADAAPSTQREPQRDDVLAGSEEGGEEEKAGMMAAEAAD